MWTVEAERLLSCFYSLVKICGLLLLVVVMSVNTMLVCSPFDVHSE